MHGSGGLTGFGRFLTTTYRNGHRMVIFGDSDSQNQNFFPVSFLDPNPCPKSNYHRGVGKHSGCRALPSARNSVLVMAAVPAQGGMHEDWSPL